LDAHGRARLSASVVADGDKLFTLTLTDATRRPESVRQGRFAAAGLLLPEGFS
jgi:hypothetical protein